MKRTMAFCLAIIMVWAVAVTNVYAGGIAAAVAEALAGSVIDDAGRVVGGVADWAQETISGNKYSSYVQGDLTGKIENDVQSINAGQDAVVQIGSETIQSSRFNDNVFLKTKNEVGAVITKEEAFVDVGSISIARTRVEGKTDIRTDNKIPGGIQAGNGSAIRVGAFTAY